MNFKFINKILPLVIIAFVTLLISSKMFLYGQYPIPGNLLVSFFFPWSSGGWVGYDSWTTHKEWIASDAIRQTIPWISISTEQIKNFSFPLWNPYNSSGNPLFANPQASVLGIFNFLFLVLPFINAWTILILIQIPLATFFTYLFCRSLGLKKAPSIFAGLAYGFSTYFLYWLEIAIVGHTILWFPLILFSIQKWFEKFNVRYLVILILSSIACIFAGHVQTQIYIFAIAAIYYLTKTLKQNNFYEKRKAFKFFLTWILLTFFITALQTLPMLELYKNSPLTAPLSKTTYQKISMPAMNFMSLLAPDTFGNPATNNFWSTIYEGNPSIGILPFFFAIFALFKLKKWEEKFFMIVSITFILFVTRSPLYYLIYQLNLPIITGTTPVRSMFVLSFSLSILSAFGLEAYLSLKNDQNKKFYRLIKIFTLFFLVLFCATLVLPNILQDKTLWAFRMSVTKRNLLLPFLIFLSLPLSIFINKFISKIVKLPFRIDIFIILITTIIGGVYQFNKISQFSPKKDFFPDHPLIEWVQKNASINRVYGSETSNFGTNFAAYYRIYSPEGYNVFRIKRYAELIASQLNGIVSDDYERADAQIIATDNNYQRRLLNLTGTKYIFSKDDQSRDAKIDEVAKPNDDVKFVWQKDKFIIYERTKVLPRFFLSSNYTVAKDDQDILNKIYDDNFDLHTIILEKSPNLEIEKSQKADINLINYEPNRISFNVNSDKNTLLFLSDAYYSGWNAYIDNVKGSILRADYAFRTVPIPAGIHSVVFKFEPNSFKYGLFLSATGILFLIVLIAGSVKKGRF